MAEDSPSIDFLYDFLYLDRDRAQSWLAQLVAEGVPLSSKHQSSTTDSNNLSASGGVPTLVNAGGSTTASVTQALERHFSNEWSIPLNLVEMLDEAAFIHRDLSKAALGSIVHIQGSATIMDIRFLQQGWEALTGFMIAQQKLTYANKSALAAQKSQMTQLGHVIQVMPPMPQLYIRTADEQIAWAVLKSDHMIVDTSALSLTYGADIKGDWHVVAVLDSLPDGESTSNRENIGNALTEGILTVLDGLRDAIGRPRHAFAVNPIAIFRAINPQS